MSDSARIQSAAGSKPGSDGTDKQKSTDAELRAKLIEARLEIMNLRNKLDMKEELRRLDVNRRPYIYLARILSIGESNPWRRSILLDRGKGNTGSKPPIVNGLVVTYGRQLIGRIHEAGRRTSRVQLLTDPNFTMRVIALPPEADISKKDLDVERPKVFLSRRTGVIEGNGSKTMNLKHILASVSVKEGWEVISAGGRGKPVPRGLLLGRVKEVSDQYGQFLRVKVQPTVNIQKIRNLMIMRPRGMGKHNPENQ